MKRTTVLVVFILSAVPGPAAAADAFPWNFNMSPAEVSAVKEYGPYRAFQNGDLETYRGIYDGHEENFQFFFTDNRLRRIGIYLYEGHDPQAAGRRWLGLHDSLSRRYGEVETPNNHVPVPAGEQGKRAFVDAALALVADAGKTQMAPAKQPEDYFVFGSFSRADVEGERWYYVVAYFDRPG